MTHGNSSQLIIASVCISPVGYRVVIGVVHLTQVEGVSAFMMLPTNKSELVYQLLITVCHAQSKKRSYKGFGAPW